jgi:ribosomal protein L31
MAHLFFNLDKNFIYGTKDETTMQFLFPVHQGYADGGLGYKVTITDAEFDDLAYKKRVTGYNDQTNTVSYEDQSMVYTSQSVMNILNQKFIEKLESLIEVWQESHPAYAQQLQNYKTSVESIDSSEFTFPLNKHLCQILEEKNLFFIHPLQLR